MLLHMFLLDAVQAARNKKAQGARRVKTEKARLVQSELKGEIGEREGVVNKR